MLTALILICSLIDTPNLADCSRANARHVVWVPETFNNPIICFRHGQANIADTTLGRSLGSDERVRVLCMPKRTTVRSDEAAVADLRRGGRRTRTAVL